MKTQSAQTKIEVPREPEPKDPWFSCGIYTPLPRTGNPAILRHREAHIALGVIGNALGNSSLHARKKALARSAILELFIALDEAKVKAGPQGLPLKLSQIWPGWNDDGSRKDENAPDPTPGKMKDQGQATKAKPSNKVKHIGKRAA